jgi:hypothetical protein
MREARQPSERAIIETYGFTIPVIYNALYISYRIGIVAIKHNTRFFPTIFYQTN